jgi:hypothetical protein
LVFKTNPFFTGTLTMAYQAVDDEGGVSNLANVQLESTMPDQSINPTTQFLPTPRPSSPPIRDEDSELTEFQRDLLQQRDSIFVIFAVRESQVEAAQFGQFADGVIDQPAATELGRVSMFLQASPVRNDSALYVQKAVHGTDITPNQNGFVRSAVQQSQLTAIARHRDITASLNRHNPNQGLSEELGRQAEVRTSVSTEIEIPSESQVSLLRPWPTDTFSSQLEQSEQASPETTADTGKVQTNSIWVLDLPTFDPMPLNPKKDKHQVSPTPTAAAGFTEQLRQAAAQREATFARV